MWEWIIRMWCGSVRVTVPIALRTAIFDWLFRAEITPYRECVTETEVSFLLLSRDIPRFRCAAAENDWECNYGAVRGLPAVLSFLGKRPGIAAGLAVLFVWCLVSQHFIWRVEISGNTHVSDAEIEALLSELGCGVGDWIPGINYDWVHANYRARSDNIAWLSVYQNGTVAEVQVRESKKPPVTQDKSGVYANVVAAQGGEVVLVEVFHGEAAVHGGDVVLPGELLISGVCQMRHENQYRLTYAAGRVIAKVACPISVEISKEREVKRYTGREKTKFSVKIFKKEINLFKNTGNPYATCDTISTMEEVCLWNRYTIPVWIGKTIYREYEIVTEKIDTATAAEEAMAELRRQIEAATADGVLVSKNVTITMSEDNCRIDCLLYCEKDIARTEEFHSMPEAENETVLQ